MRGKQLLFLVFFAPFHSCNNLPTPTLEPIDQFTQAPVVRNVTPGAVVNLWTRNAGGISALVVTSSPAAASVVRVPLPHRLSPGQIVQAQTRQRWFGFPWFGSQSGLSNPVVVENNYVTNRYDNERSGWNPNESILTVDNVRDNVWNVFGKICQHQVEGAIRAQPLYVLGCNIPC